MALANAETHIQAAIRLRIQEACPAARMFRNNTGRLIDPRSGRPVSFGLAVGSPDLVGWRPVTITKEMVGQTIAQFVGLEVKTSTGRLRPDQEAFLSVLAAAGGLASVVRSPDDAVRIMSQ